MSTDLNKQYITTRETQVRKASSGFAGNMVYNTVKILPANTMVYVKFSDRGMVNGKASVIFTLDTGEYITGEDALSLKPYQTKDSNTAGFVWE